MKSKITLYAYDGCDTCRKARKWLDAHQVAYEPIPIVTNPPSRLELGKLVKSSGIPARKWLNTSGQSYRAMVAEIGKEATLALSDSEIINRLANDGKLIKRPVLVAPDRVLVGFRAEEYEGL